MQFVSSRCFLLATMLGAVACGGDNGQPAATTRASRVLLTDGPFVDSKEFLAGLILIEAENLDGALAVAAELQELDITAAIEVRPLFEQELGGA